LDYSFQTPTFARPRTALGATERTAAAGDGRAVYRRFADQSCPARLSSFGGLQIPASIGPFSYFDARLTVTQSLFDWKSINAARAASQSLKSSEYTFKDARDLVVLAVGYTYLEAIADAARIETAEAQVKTAQALFEQGDGPGDRGEPRPMIDGLAGEGGTPNPAAAIDPGQASPDSRKLTVARRQMFWAGSIAAAGLEFHLRPQAVDHGEFPAVTWSVACSKSACAVFTGASAVSIRAASAIASKYVYPRQARPGSRAS